jgi:hypothetical protein
VTRGPYEPERARQLRILLLLVLGVAVFLLGWAGMILAGHGSTANALRVLVVPGLLLALLAAGALRALAADGGTARVWVAAAGAVTVVVALLLSRTFAGLLIAVIGVPLLLIGVLPGRDEGPQRPGG